MVYMPSDGELRVEIEMLNKSTEEYKRQTEVLSCQREVLEGIRKREQEVKEARGKLREKRRRKWIAERGRLGADVGFSLPWLGGSKMGRDSDRAYMWM